MTLRIRYFGFSFFSWAEKTFFLNGFFVDLFPRLRMGLLSFHSLSCEISFLLRVLFSVYVVEYIVSRGQIHGNNC